jgi:hypothetical protein
VAVYPIDVHGLTNIQSQGIDASTSNIDSMYPEIGLERSSNIQAQTTGSMEFLASATGGRAYYNTNNIALGIRSAIEDSSSYYMLGYYVDQHVKSGWQTIAVKVREKGANVRARDGVFIKRDSSDDTTEGDAELRAAVQSPVDYTGLRIDVKWTDIAEPQSKTQGKKKIGFELLLPAGSATLDGDHFNLELLAVARDLQGASKAELSQTITGHLTAENQAKLRNNGFTYRNSAVLAPGRYLVRFVVRDQISGQIGSVLAPLTVP